MKLIYPKEPGYAVSNIMIIDGKSIEVKISGRRVTSNNKPFEMRWLYNICPNSIIDEIRLKKYLELRRIELIFKERIYNAFHFLNKYDSHLHEVANLNYTQELLEKLLDDEPKKNISNLINPKTLSPSPINTVISNSSVDKPLRNHPIIHLEKKSSSSMGEISERFYREEPSEPVDMRALYFGDHKLFFHCLKENGAYHCRYDESLPVKVAQIQQLRLYIRVAVLLTDHADFKRLISLLPSKEHFCRTLNLKYRTLGAYLKNLNERQETSFSEHEINFLSNSLVKSYVDRICLYMDGNDLSSPDEVELHELNFSNVILQLADDHIVCFKTRENTDKYYLNYSVLNISKVMFREYKILECYFEFCLQKFDSKEFQRELSFYKYQKYFLDLVGELIGLLKEARVRSNYFSDTSETEVKPDHFYEMTFSQNIMQLLMEPCFQAAFKNPVIDEEYFKSPIQSQPESLKVKEINLPELFNEEDDEALQLALQASLKC